MNTVEILEAAKAKIANPEHWMKGFYAKDAEGTEITGYEVGAVCFCSLGAIEAATGIPHCGKGWPKEAEDFLNGAARNASDEEGKVYTGTAGYNDSHTHEQVMALWDDAINAAKAASNKGEKKCSE